MPDARAKGEGVEAMTWEEADEWDRKLSNHSPVFHDSEVGLALSIRRLIALARQERERAEALERGQLAPITADRTGHLYRCAKINGVWSCAEGCAVKRAEREERVIAESQRIADKWEDAARKEMEMAEMYKETALLETGLREAAEAEIHALKARAERAEVERDSLMEDNEGTPVMYCPTCESCGISECCNPFKCKRFICPYPAYAKEAYDEALADASKTYEEMQSLRSLADALAEAVEGYITVNNRENVHSLFWRERAKFYEQMGERLAAYREGA